MPAPCQPWGSPEELSCPQEQHVSTTLGQAKAKGNRGWTERCSDPHEDGDKDVPLTHEEQSHENCHVASRLKFLCAVRTAFSS